MLAWATVPLVLLVTSDLSLAAAIATGRAG